jgi:hypothetical protein
MREADDAVAVLLQYEHWCTDKLGAKIEGVARHNLQRRFPIGHGTLHASFYHLVTGKTYPGLVAVTIRQLRDRYAIAAEQMLANNIALNAVDETARDDAWEIRRNHLIHITTHGMHHRAQMINMLTQLGVTAIIEGGDFGGWANRRVRKRSGK